MLDAFLKVVLSHLAHKAREQSKRKSLICANCHEVVRKADKFCRKCGGSGKTTYGEWMDERREEAREEAPSPPSESQIQLKKNQEEYAKRKLHTDFLDEIKILEASKRCDECGTRFPGEVMFCPSCGVSIKPYSSVEIIEVCRGKFPTLGITQENFEVVKEESGRLKIESDLPGLLSCCGCFTIFFIISVGIDPTFAIVSFVLLGIAARTIKFFYE